MLCCAVQHTFPRNHICADRGRGLGYAQIVLETRTAYPMPIWNPCATPGCSQFVEADALRHHHCPQHRRENQRMQRHNRSSDKARGYTNRWRRASKMLLRRDPVCKICNRNPSTETDHIIPKVEGGTEHPDNLQGLCKTCHSRKTRREKRR